jgi:hypothetical protein
VNPQVNPNGGVPLLDDPIHWTIKLTIKTSNPRQAINDPINHWAHPPMDDPCTLKRSNTQAPVLNFKYSPALE